MALLRRGGPPARAGRGRAGAEPRQKLEKYQRATVEEKKTGDS